ncbi:unnamed protein product [Ilex paraguariensis]|uniref:RING-type E3 ubiquitin transferase n=1 Tax=Ilex paraguariensis TaxID=185542 RepID=A0ABC8SF43_9AQUA
MDADLENISSESPQPTVHGHMNGTLAVDHFCPQAACALCERILSSDNQAGNLEAISICGDCEFLFLEDIGTPIHHSHQRRPPRLRRRYSSSESIENLFSQQFSHLINLARQNQPSVSENENQSVDNDAAASLGQQTSSRTTPSASRRWRRRVLSDTESDGFDSFYGESESNVSFSGYRLFPGESDTVSFSAYGGDSDASVDDHSFLDNEIFGHPDRGSDVDSDTDMDPMHAGLNQWNSDDEEEDEDDDEEDIEWEEADAEENTVDSLEMGAQLERSLSSNEGSLLVNSRRHLHSPEFEGTFPLRIRDRGQTYIPNILANLESSELQRYIRNSGDYLDARGFEELLEHLADTDSSRRGAPPAAVSFVTSLPHVVINEEHEKQDTLACAICKESLSVGTAVNQLPCFHFYHPSCILPWLSARNSCPLCRYELPTDDKDYEDGKRSSGSGLEIQEIQQQGMNEDSFSDITDGDEADEANKFSHGQTEQGELLDVDRAAGTYGRERERGRWFFLAAAAPIVSLVGIALVLWLGNPLTGRRGPVGVGEFPVQGQHPNHSLGSRPSNRRENHRSGSWWSLF